MRKILFIFCLLFAFTVSIKAGTREVGIGKGDLYAYKFAGHTYVIMSFKDDEDDYRMVAIPIIRMKLFDGKVIELNGTDQSQETKTHSISWFAGISSGGSDNVHYAVFSVNNEFLESLKIGVQKIVINTIPNIYVKSYTEDKIGKALIWWSQNNFVILHRTT